jgi:hypothetical protein
MMTLTGLVKGSLKTAGVIALKNSLELYARLGNVPNRLIVPSKLLNVASSITGTYYSTHKLESYHRAVKDLEAWIDRYGGTYTS